MLALRRLDALIERAVAAAQIVYGPGTSADLYRGLYISEEEVARLLAKEPGTPLLWPHEVESVGPLEGAGVNDLPFAWVARFFGLSPFDLDVLLVGLAPEIDLRYERLYAYLQNNVSRRRPSIDLTLNLLCSSAEAKLARRGHFAADAPLIRHELVRLLADPDQIQPPLLAHYLKVDDQIVNLLLGSHNLDSRLAPFCELVMPAVSLGQSFLDEQVKLALVAQVLRAQAAGWPVRLYFRGSGGSGRRHAAEGLAKEVGMFLLVANLARGAQTIREWGGGVRLLLREAWIHHAILYIDGLDVMREGDRGMAYRELLEALSRDSGAVIIAGARPWVPVGELALGIVEVPFAIPAPEQRRECWQTHLSASGVSLEHDKLAVLAERFRLTPGQIADAAGTALNCCLGRPEKHSPGAESPELCCLPDMADLFAAARAQSGHELAALAHKIQPIYTWGDIVLPPDTVSQLREICQRVTHCNQVLGNWGFGRKLSLGKGVNALFAGPSGTGKTMAAEIIANELVLDLYKIELSGVVSKYIGETEKNLDRIFTAAENANAILFFDEADALFGKRSEVRDSHDRYANIEISYLLQKMEQYEGIAILATNLRQNLDEAFVRRLAFTVHFPFPDEASRQRIWDGIWPKALPLGSDVDSRFLARQFKLSGGNIKNIALAASFLAAADGKVVTMAHLFQATQREYQKMGKALSAAELYGETRATASGVR